MPIKRKPWPPIGKTQTRNNDPIEHRGRLGLGAGLGEHLDAAPRSATSGWIMIAKLGDPTWGGQRNFRYPRWTYPNSSSSACASFRSRVPKPSVNQP